MTEAPAPSSQRVTSVILILLLMGALGLRVLRCHEGLPYLHEWDEPQTASTALHILKTGDYNPHFFNYGSFMIYANTAVDALHYLVLSAFSGIPHAPDGLEDILTEHDTGWHWTISHPSFILWNRYLVALMGASTVLITYLIACALGGVGAGLTAAACVSVLDFHVYHSSIVTPNAPMAMLVMLACYASLKHIEGGGTSFLIASFALCGVALSAQAAVSAVRSWEAATVRETRSRLVDAVNLLLAGEDRQARRVGIAAELRVHEEDLARVVAPVEVAPYEELCRLGSQRYDMVVGASSFQHDVSEDEERARRLNTLQPAGMTVLRRIDGRWTHLTFLSINPGLKVYGGVSGIQSHPR